MPAVKRVAKVTPTRSDPYVPTLLARISEGKREMSVRKGKKIFSQGERAGAIYFVHTGRVKVSVVSFSGKEAVLALLGPHDFFGEGSLVGQSVRLSTAMAVAPTIVFQVTRRAMLRALHEQTDLAEKFMGILLARNIALEEDLCDQLFNHSEKRLARVLVKLSRLRMPDATLPNLSHETLAEMVGTTRARVTHFMNKFRKLGLIEYNGHLTVRTELLTDVVLHN
jgi:CRP/FNR family transcriptional regulator, cyclic AMP receptor protein